MDRVMGTVEVTESGRGKLALDVTTGVHHLVADEGPTVGGTDTGPSPHDFLLVALGSCTVMTLRLYAERKGYALRKITAKLSQRKIKAADCPDCVSKEGEVEEMFREITLEGDLDAEARARLLDIANRCPVHKALTGEIKIRTTLS